MWKHRNDFRGSSIGRGSDAVSSDSRPGIRRSRGRRQPAFPRRVGCLPRSARHRSRHPCSGGPAPFLSGGSALYRKLEDCGFREETRQLAASVVSVQPCPTSRCANWGAAGSESLLILGVRRTFGCYRFSGGAMRPSVPTLMRSRDWRNRLGRHGKGRSRSDPLSMREGGAGRVIMVRHGARSDRAGWINLTDIQCS